MKKQNATNVVVGVIALVQTLSAQYVSVSPVPGNETVIQHIYVDNTVKAPPRNDLWDGVDKAIRNVKMMYGSANLQSVLNEIENMAKRNEIRLPYSYEVRWSASVNGNGGTYHHKKKKLNSENRQRKAEFERYPKYEQAYMRAFEKMLSNYDGGGTPGKAEQTYSNGIQNDTDGKIQLLAQQQMKWKNTNELMEWWIK